MTNDIDARLHAKEKRRDRIETFLKQHPVILVLKTNLPGDKTHSTEAALLLRQFNHLCETFLHIPGEFHQAADGDYYLYGTKTDAKKLKKHMLYLEDNHPLGRLVDLDVHTPKGPLTRKQLNVTERRCFLCDKPATVCRRENNHDENELVAFIENRVRREILDALKRTAVDALRKEIFTYPCFGLVSSKNSGIHKDMNISHFLSALEVLEQAFETYLRLGLEDTIDLDALRARGKEHEERLLSHCKNINTHKGAHFIFGLILPHMIRTLFANGTFDAMLAAIKKDAAKITTSDFTNLKTAKTCGEKAYQQHQIKGVRGELENGLQSIMDWYPQKTLSPIQKLVKIMARLEDTTLMKTGKETLNDVKACMQAVEAADFQTLEKIQDCLKDTVSPGGAADLLAVTFFFENTDHLFAKTP